MTSAGDLVIFDRLKLLRRRLFAERKQPLSKAPILGDAEFLFVGGLHRSGTSILHRALRDHADISGLKDTPAAQDEGQHLQSVYPTASAMGGPGEFVFNIESHVAEPDVASIDCARQTILREWGPYFDLNKRVLIEKSPPNLIRSRSLQALFPGSRFAFIVRHPIIVSMSTQKWTNSSITRLLHHWCTAYARLIDDLPALQHKKILRYEDFTAAPQLHADNLCEWLGLSTFKLQQAVIDKSAKYFESMSDDTAAEVDQFCKENPDAADFIASLGYTMSAPHLLHEPSAEWLRMSRLVEIAPGDR